MTGYKMFLLKDILQVMGEDEVKNTLSHFSCPINHDVEKFLHEKAIVFEQQNKSSTYLLYASYKKKMELAGYFTLANKTLVLSQKSVDKRTSSGRYTTMSNTMRKKIGQAGKFDKTLGVYTISAPLIGQLSRNFSKTVPKLISGDELLKIACDKVWESQRLLSGHVVYLECEDKHKLIDFYSSNGFVVFGERELDEDEKTDLSGKCLVQMLKDLRPSHIKNDQSVHNQPFSRPFPITILRS